jgi:hypothetical protein
MKLTSLKKLKVLKKVGIVVVVVLLLGAGGYYALSASGYLDAFQLGRQVQEQQKMAAEDQIVLDKLKQIILLPDNITPKIATITDIEILKKNQSGFFSNAKNGDSLIMYQDMAIIYDSKANKIIKIGPVQNNQTAQTVQPQQPVSQQPAASTKPQKTPSKT